ncbi:MAG: endolytic transglycosylase MltG [Alphaproteobacteria bacterium]
MTGGQPPIEVEPGRGDSRLDGATDHKNEPAGGVRPRRGRGLRRLLGTITLSLLLLIGLGVGGFYYALSLIDQPGPLQIETSVVIARGTPVTGIATQLQAAGVIERAGLFAFAVRVLGRSQPLRAGEFPFPPRVSVRESMAILQSGATVVRRLTIPEGLTTAQVLALVAAADGLSGPLPESPGEGLLLPETYHFSLAGSRTEIVDRMRQDMTGVLAELWLQRAPDLPFVTPDEALILASIVEKETGLDGERPRIAAVFINRLRRGMRLQSDPTVAYGLVDNGQPLERALTRADLRVQHPYNTYQIDGLPPGPIANAGRSSIEAVLHPGESKDLYFVADGSGGHAFATNLKGHNRNVAKWRRIRRNAAGG